MTVYDHGDDAILTVTFRDADGDLTDPATVKFRAVDPADQATDWTYGVDDAITRSSAGVYVATLPLPAVGLWAYYWTTEAGLYEDSVLQVTRLSTDRSAAEQIARHRLTSMLAPTMHPKLGDEVLDELLAGARRLDAEGRSITDPDWVETYDLNAAAEAGWERKAGLAAGGYDFGEDGQNFSRSQIHQQCLNMAELYRRGGAASARTRSGALEDYIAATGERTPVVG